MPKELQEALKKKMLGKYGNERVCCEINGVEYKFKSRSEYKYACYLEFLRLNGDILEWQYEPQVFSWHTPGKLGRIYHYKPDFKVVEKIGVAPSGMIEARRSWHEVKGYMDTRSKSKLKGFAKHFPDEKLILVDAPWFRRNTKKLKGLVKGWI